MGRADSFRLPTARREQRADFCQWFLGLLHPETPMGRAEETNRRLAVPYGARVPATWKRAARSHAWRGLPSARSGMAAFKAWKKCGSVGKWEAAVTAATKLGPAYLEKHGAVIRSGFTVLEPYCHVTPR